MLFKDIMVGGSFTRSSNETLVWTRSNEFTAYGNIIKQNAAAYNKPNGPWHYDRISDDEEVNPVPSVNESTNITEPGALA